MNKRNKSGVVLVTDRSYTNDTHQHRQEIFMSVFDSPNPVARVPTVAVSREQGEHAVLNDLVYVGSMNKYWWVAKRTFISGRALNVFLTPLLISIGITALPTTWLKRQAALRRVLTVDTLPGEPLIVGDVLNLWRDHAA
jgi:hypothetical protein